jgi:hypothetical protein
MRNFGLALAVFATSFALSSIAFVQSNKSSNQKQTAQKTQTASKQEVRCPVSGKVIADTKNAPEIYLSWQDLLLRLPELPRRV